jgi:cation diffusion facilitator CzcD-associated flavoprotein CzcO
MLDAVIVGGGAAGVAAATRLLRGGVSNFGKLFQIGFLHTFITISTVEP